MLKKPIIIDAHTDLFYCLNSTGFDFEKNKKRQIDLPKIKKAGVNLIFASVIPYQRKNFYLETKKQLLFYKKLAKKHQLKIIKTANDLEKLTSNDLAILIHLEGAEAVRNEKILKEFFSLGLRSMSLTWNISNHLAGGANDALKPKGISSFGKKIIKLANYLGIILDAAHLNQKSFFQIFSFSKKPVIVSHANAFFLLKKRRNLTLAQAKLVKKKNGVIGLFFSGKFVSKTSPSINDLIKHFIFFKKHLGVQFLGIGSDFGGITGSLVKNLEDIGKLSFLLKALKKHNFFDKEINQILGENFKRVIIQTLPKK